MMLLHIPTATYPLLATPGKLNDVQNSCAQGKIHYDNRQSGIITALKWHVHTGPNAIPAHFIRRTFRYLHVKLAPATLYATLIH